MRRLRKGMLFAVTVTLSACAGLPPAVKLGSLALSGMSYLVTGKGPSDHVISAVAEQDCALLRIVRGQPVCITASPEPAFAGSRVRAAEDPPPSLRKVVSPAARSAVTDGHPQVYLVLGSFSDPTNAHDWRQRLYPLATRIATEQTRTGQIAYRVITGPVPVATSRTRQAELQRIGLAPWRLTLCNASLKPPPCNATLVAGR